MEYSISRQHDTAVECWDSKLEHNKHAADADAKPAILDFC